MGFVFGGMLLKALGTGFAAREKNQLSTPKLKPKLAHAQIPKSLKSS